MMKLGNTTVAVATLALLLFGNGCDVFRKRKPNPPPSIPPSIERNKKIDLPPVQPTPPPTTEPAPPIQPTPEPPKKKPRHIRTPKKVIIPPESTEPPKPAPDASINAPMDNAQAARQKQQTGNLLGAAENNLSNLHRSLSGDEQQMVSQVRNYIAQSRKAMTDGDLERAYNLANKANLLSSELVKE